MAERMEIVVDVQQSRALDDVRSLARAFDQLSESEKRAESQLASTEQRMTALGKAAGSTSASLTEVGKSSDTTARSVAKVGDESASAGKKATAAFDPLASVTSKISSSLAGMATGGAGFVASLVGLGGITQLLSTFLQQLKEIEEIRNRMIEGKAAVDLQVQALAANLGIPFTPQGQQQTMQILRTLKAATPQASIPIIGAVAGQVQSVFGPAGLDVTRAGAGQQMTGLLASYSAAMGLSEEEAQGLPLILKNFGATDVNSAKRVLAGITQAQKSTGIANPAAFARQFLRVGAAYAPQGLGIEGVAGIVAASALGANDPRLAGTRAEQMLRGIMGKDETAEAALGGRALAMGIITPKAVAAAGAGLPRTEQETTLAESIAKNQREAADLEADRQRQRARDDAEAKLRRDRIATARTPVARESAQLEDSRATEANAKRERDQAQTLADRRQAIGDAQRKLEKSRSDRALARAYRALPVGQRVEAFRRATTGMTEAQRSEFFSETMKAAPEEVGALNILATSGAGAFTEASRAVAGVGRREVGELEGSMTGYAQSSLGRAQGARDTIALQEATAVRSEEEVQKQFKEQSASRANIFNTAWERMTPAERAASGMANTTVDRTKFLMYARDALQQIYRFYADMSDEERKAHPEIREMIGDIYAYSTNPQYVGRRTELVDVLYRRFVRTARLIVGERAGGVYPTRTMTSPGEIGVYGEAGEAVRIVGPEALGGGDVIERVTKTAVPPIDIDPGAALSEFQRSRATTQPTTRPTTQQTPPPAPPSTQPSASAMTVPTQVTYYTEHVGNKFVAPGGHTDFEGRGEGYFG